jgi:hypothetical protein
MALVAEQCIPGVLARVIDNRIARVHVEADLLLEPTRDGPVELADIADGWGD